MRYRPCDGVLPRRVLQDRARRPWKPHDLRGGHCRVSRASNVDRQRSEYSDATIRFSRSCGGRSVVRYRSKLAPFSSRRGGGICGLSLDPRACPRNSSSRSPPRARCRRSNWTRRSPRLVSADAWLRPTEVPVFEPVGVALQREDLQRAERSTEDDTIEQIGLDVGHAPMISRSSYSWIEPSGLVAPRILVPFRFAPVRVAPDRFAPVRVAPVRFAPVRVASVRSAPLRLA